MALLFYFFVYLLLAFAWRSLVVYKRSGQNPLVLPTRDDAYGYVGRAFKILIVLVAAVVALDAIAPSWMPLLGTLHYLQTSLCSQVGWTLLVISLLFLLVAQAQMGNSWRIGIDEKNRTELVSTGLFSFSRNPIFLSMRINLFGLFLVRPNAVTLAVVAAGEVLMQVQVRLEEAHLQSLHGDKYIEYSSTVRRWL
ncbi:MAG: methyltransferase family protein [Formosimonas sp.]